MVHCESALIPAASVNILVFARRFPSGGAKSGIGLLDTTIDPLKDIFVM